MSEEKTELQKLKDKRVETLRRINDSLSLRYLTPTEEEDNDEGTSN